MQQLEDRVAVVTGAASGIGRALVERFAAERMRVVAADVERKALATVVQKLRGQGAEVLDVVTDVSKEEQVAALADAAAERFGRIHVVCNNAGVGVAGAMWDLSAADWQWVLGVNLWGVIHGIRAFVPRMLAGGEEGHVVNTASVAGLMSGPYMGPYNASKHAVVTISETLRQELAMRESRIKVSVLCPGPVDTRIPEAGRNRPRRLGGRSYASEDSWASMLSAILAAGVAPEAVADRVVDAIRAERFYIFTQPGTKALVAQRVADMEEGERYAGAPSDQGT